MAGVGQWATAGVVAVAPSVTRWISSVRPPDGPRPRRSLRPRLGPWSTATPSARSEVTGLSAIPHGTMWSNMERSVRHVEGEPVGRAAPRRPHPDGPIFGDRWRRAASGSSETHPHPRVPASRPTPDGGSPRATSASMTHLLDPVDVLGSAVGPGPYGDQRIADQLTGAVEGDVTTPVDPDQVGTDRGRVHQHVVEVTVAADRVDRRVLQQEEVVVGRAPGRRPAAAPTTRGRARGPASGPSSASGRSSRSGASRREP